MIDSVYKMYFYAYLYSLLKIGELDMSIERSNAYFGESKNLTKSCHDMFRTRYIRCLNTLYIDKISEEDKNIMLDKSVDNKTKFDIIEKTFKDVIYKDGVNYITYDFATKDRVIKNGTLVFEIVYGRNIVKLDKANFALNEKKQDKVVEGVINTLESRVKDILGIECKVLVRREL